MSAIATAITTRSTGTNGVNGVTVKNSPLSNSEIDTNFINLNANKLELGDCSAANVNNTVVKRDGSGNFAASTITAALSGNATTATTLQTARNINGVSFNGSADIVTTTTYDSTYNRITNPGGGYWSQGTPTVTGALAISLPVAATNTMIRVTIKVYEYVTNESFELHVGGYIYSGNTWANSPFAYIVGNPTIDRRFNVRLGYTSAGKMVIYIGETNSTWSYPQVFVTDVQCGFGGMASTFLSGWSIGAATTLENVTATIASTDIQVGWTAQSLQTANNYQVNSIGVGVAANGTAGRIDATTLVLSGSEQVNSLGVGTAASGTAGEIRATNQISSYYSDERLKENINQIVGALSKVKQLRGVTFNANSVAAEYGYDTSVEQVGVIAQDVKKVLPQIVVPAPFDRKEEDGVEVSASGKDYMTVQYEKLVPLLIEAIKELSAEVESLKGSK